MSQTPRSRKRPRLYWGPQPVSVRLLALLARFRRQWQRLYWGDETVAAAVRNQTVYLGGWLWQRPLAIVFVTAMTWLLLLSGDQLRTLGAFIRGWLPTLTLSPPSLAHSDKFGHAALFAIACVLIRQAWPASASRWTVFVLVALAFATELLQRAIPGRSGSVGDVVADLVGVLCGAIAYRLWISIVYNRQSQAAR